MTQEKAIQEAKDIVAKKHGYFNFRSVVSVLDSGNISFEKFEAIVTEAMLEYASSSSEKGFIKLDMERMYLIGLLNRDKMDMDTLSEEMGKAREKFEAAINFIKSLTPKEHSEGDSGDNFEALSAGI